MLLRTTVTEMQVPNHNKVIKIHVSTVKEQRLGVFSKMLSMKYDWVGNSQTYAATGYKVQHI